MQINQLLFYVSNLETIEITGVLLDPDCYAGYVLIKTVGNYRLCAKRQELYKIKKGEQLQDEFELLLTSKPMDIFIQNLKAMYGSGDFRSLDEAKDIIEKSHYKPKSKEYLQSMLDYISRVKSLNQGKTLLDNKSQKELMRKFNKLNLSPITIPADFNRPYYPNPIKYLLNETNLYLADN